MGRSVNGIELNSIEYAELEMLVSSDDPRGVAAERVDFDGSQYDLGHVMAYRGLRDKGLIEGRDNHGYFIFDSMTPDGMAYIDDLKTQEREKRKERRHDVYVALVGSIAGCVFTVIGALVAKILG